MPLVLGAVPGVVVGGPRSFLACPGGFRFCPGAEVDGLVVGREGVCAGDVSAPPGVVLMRGAVVAGVLTGVVRRGDGVFARNGVVTAGRGDRMGTVVTGACAAPFGGATAV